MLIIDDPDAPVGDWVHFIVYNIPDNCSEIKENSLPSGAEQGFNDFKKLEYGGPCPPNGTHRYFFKLYAIDTKLKFSTPPRKADILKSIEGHVLGQVQIIGLYPRQ